MQKLRADRDVLAAFRRSKSTQSGYQSDFLIFSAWCVAAVGGPLPASADIVSLFLAAQLSSGHRIDTAERRMNALLFMHHQKGLSVPDSKECRLILCGARHQRREKPGGKTALCVSDLMAVCRKSPVCTRVKSGPALPASAEVR